MIEYNLEKILDFVQKHLDYPDRNLLKQYVKKHEEFGTLDYAIDTNSNIIAFCRWNVVGNIADVLDFAIKREYRNKCVGRDFILRAMNKFPDINKIRFQRSLRGDERFKVIDINSVLKKNIF